MEWSTPSNNDAIASLLSALEDENKDKAFWKNFFSKYGPWLGSLCYFPIFAVCSHDLRFLADSQTDGSINGINAKSPKTSASYEL